MSYIETGTHKKRRIAHPGCAVAQQVHLLSLLRVFELTGTRPLLPRPLSSAVLARTTGMFPKHHASASAKLRDVNNTGDFTATLLESALASIPTLAGGVSATLAPCLSRHGQPAATLLRKGDSSMVYILTTLTILALLRQMQRAGRNMQNVRNQLEIRTILLMIKKRVMERISHVLRMPEERLKQRLQSLGGMQKWEKTPGKQRKTLLYWKKFLQEANIDWTEAVRMTQ